MFEFTIKIYKELLAQLAERECYAFAEFVEQRPAAGVVLRHDVDKRPGQSLLFAQLQHELGIRGTYYFRSVRESFDPGIIEAIAGMGHEIGYHYEDLTLVARGKNEERRTENAKRITETGDRRRETEEGRGANSEQREPESQRSKGESQKSKVESRKSDDELFGRAIVSFERNLAKLRRYADVRTICMHGSPLSKWDSRLLWERFDYRDYGIAGEPYFDVDFSTVAYYTDTGRRWDGSGVSVRDKPRVETGNRKPVSGVRSPISAFPVFRSTFDMIRAMEAGEFPGCAMLTFHPQRWTDAPGLWVRELIAQNVKNVVKKMIVRSGEKRIGNWRPEAENRRAGEGSKEKEMETGDGRREG